MHLSTRLSVKGWAFSSGLRCWMALAGMLTCQNLAAASGEFAKLPTEKVVTAMAPTEDGKYLVIAHQVDNKVSVWDLAELKLVREIDCDSPRDVLCRGQRIFVSNYGKGSISVLDVSKNWKVVDKVMTGIDAVTDLAAPGGSNFKGVLLAQCYVEATRSEIIAIDVKKDQHRKLWNEVNEASLSADYRGTFFFTQEYNGSHARSMSQCYDLPKALEGRREPFGQRSREDVPLMKQMSDNEFWFGGDTVLQGWPHSPTVTKRGKLVLPDIAQPIFYFVDENALHAAMLTSDLAEFAKRDMKVPPQIFMQVTKSAPRRPKSKSSRSTKEPPAAVAIPADQSPSAPSAALTNEERQRHDYHNVSSFAISSGAKVVLVAYAEVDRAIYWAKVDAFEVPAIAAKLAAIPKQIPVGKPFTYKLLDAKDKGKVELVTAPEGLKLTSDGTLKWTPTKKDLGPAVIKLRVGDGESDFQRIEIEVVDASAVAGGPRPRLDRRSAVERRSSRQKEEEEADLPGKQVLSEGLDQVVIPSDMQSTLLLTGSKVVELDADGMKVVATHEMPQPYKRLAERNDHWVALGDHSLDLLEKKTWKVKKSIPLIGTKSNDLAIHPAGIKAYVTVINTDGGKREGLTSKRVLEINETTGRVKEIPRVYGTWVQADPMGKYLYVALRERYQAGIRIDWNIGAIMPDYGEIDILVNYDMSGGGLKHITTNTKPGTNGSSLIVAPDGKNVAYVSGGGPPGAGYTIPAFRRDDIKNTATSYATGAYPTAIAFHPILDIVATCNSREAPMIFTRSTGRELPDRIEYSEDVDDSKTFRPGVGRAEHVSFSANGTHVLMGSKNPHDHIRALKEGIRLVRCFPLRLSDAEKGQLAKGFRRPTMVAQTKSEPTTGRAEAADAEPAGNAEGKAVPLAQIEALQGRGAQRSVTAKEISHQFTPAVVLVECDSGSGTGIVIGSSGFILTCAHVVSEVGEPTVSYQLTGGGAQSVEKAPAEIYRIDKENDLALLKIKVKSKLRTVQFLTKGSAESGEEVTVIGNPGIGETILTNTVTSGIVSSPLRMIDGHAYVQTSAPINGGNSGGPMFNSKGQMLGVVVAKARIENTGFAIPMKNVLKFLAADNSVKPSGKGAELASVGKQSKNAERMWTDRSGKSIRASLIAVEDGKVTLKKPDGATISVPLERLCDADQIFLKE